MSFWNRLLNFIFRFNWFTSFHANMYGRIHDDIRKLSEGAEPFPEWIYWLPVVSEVDYCLRCGKISGGVIRVWLVVNCCASFHTSKLCSFARNLNTSKMTFRKSSDAMILITLICAWLTYTQYCACHRSFHQPYILQFVSHFHLFLCQGLVPQSLCL